ncbi:MAG: DNA polymerase III subunit delta [Eubacterium sp.]|jgi:DNA polymerase-3 subunit delta|nr:DNA polymerase III subunit delta [Eubacterium sp.]
MISDEANFKKRLASSDTCNIYMLFGKEAFLTKTYTERILKKYLQETDQELKEFNFLKLSEFRIDRLCEAVEALPVFAPFKVVLLADIDYDKLDSDTVKAFCTMIGQVPDTTILIISNVIVELDSSKAKPKKIIAAVEKEGVAVKFDYLSPAKIAQMIIKKSAKRQVNISKSEALYLTEMTLRDLTLIGREMDKLCDYAGKGGTITKSDIDALVTKRLDTGIFELSAAIIEKNTAKAFNKLNELSLQGHQPVVILSALGMTFADYYRIILGTKKGFSTADIIRDFAYPANRAWAVSKSMNVANVLGLAKVRTALKALNSADKKLKSSPVDSEVALQNVIVELIGVL